MDVPKEFERNIWPLIKDYLPRGKKTNVLYDIKNKIRGAKDSNTIKNVTWEIIEKNFSPNIIDIKTKKIVNKKIDTLFQAKEK